MPLTRYISAEWVEPTTPGMPRMIKAIGDDGNEYLLPGSEPRLYDVPPWPDFIKTEEGKALLEQAARAEPDITMDGNEPRLG